MVTSRMMMDQAAPTLSAFSPSRVAAGVSTAGGLVFSFSEAVQVGSGELVLRPKPTGSAATAPISEKQFSFSGGVLSWNPSLDLLDSVQYTAVMGAGSIEDEGQVAHAGITGTMYEFAMLDQTAPTLSTYSTSREAAFVAMSGNLVFS